MKQLATFFSLAYLISWVIWLPLYGPALGLAGLPTLPIHHAWGGLGPLIAAFLTTWLYDGKPGLRLLVQRCLQLKPVAYLLIALLSPTLLAVLAILIGAAVDGSPMNFSGLLHAKEFPDWGLPLFFAYNLLFFGFGEEVGWRGFALPRLQTRMNALSATLLVTAFWALWHWPLFLYRPGYVAMDISGVVGWVLSLLTGAVLLTWLFNGSRGRVLICAVFHSTIDLAFTADFTASNAVGYMGFLITVWGIVTVVVFRPRHLAPGPRVQTEG